MTDLYSRTHTAMVELGLKPLDPDIVAEAVVFQAKGSSLEEALWEAYDLRLQIEHYRLEGLVEQYTAVQEKIKGQDELVDNLSDSLMVLEEKYP